MFSRPGPQRERTFGAKAEHILQPSGGLRPHGEGLPGPEAKAFEVLRQASLFGESAFPWPGTNWVRQGRISEGCAKGMMVCHGFETGCATHLGRPACACRSPFLGRKVCAAIGLTFSARGVVTREPKLAGMEGHAIKAAGCCRWDDGGVDMLRTSSIPMESAAAGLMCSSVNLWIAENMAQNTEPPPKKRPNLSPAVGQPGPGLGVQLTATLQSSRKRERLLLADSRIERLHRQPRNGALVQFQLHFCRTTSVRTLDTCHGMTVKAKVSKVTLPRIERLTPGQQSHAGDRPSGGA
jgi:hypothetical protein